MPAASPSPWAPYEPDSSRPWTPALAGHLLRRAGFGGNQKQLQQAVAEGPQRTIDRLLTPPPDLAAFDQRMAELGRSLMLSDDAGSNLCAELWLYRMLQTPYPLQERMTLGWHNYFAIAGARAGKVSLMERHVRLLRRHALGRFDALLRDLCQDPATLIALGARSSTQARPPVEFASALVGQYTLGPGRYADADVREAARAFTGVSVLRDEYRFVGAHDETDDVLKKLLADPATLRLVVRKMYRSLISETAEPADALIEPLAAAFGRDYDIARLAGTMLRSNLFFSPVAYRQRVKSPLDYALALTTALDATAAPAALHQQLAALGQRLCEPPSREGWAGGRRWLNRFTLVGRGNLAATLAGETARSADSLLATLLQNDIPADAAARVASIKNPRDLVQAIATLPEFQLA